MPRQTATAGHEEANDSVYDEPRRKNEDEPEKDIHEHSARLGHLHALPARLSGDETETGHGEQDSRGNDSYVYRGIEDILCQLCKITNGLATAFYVTILRHDLIN